MSHQDRNKAGTPDDMADQQRDVQTEIDGKAAKAPDTEKPQAIAGGAEAVPDRVRGAASRQAGT